jgi:hypothetical protein
MRPQAGRTLCRSIAYLPLLGVVAALLPKHSGGHAPR